MEKKKEDKLILSYYFQTYLHYLNFNQQLGPFCVLCTSSCICVDAEFRAWHTVSSITLSQGLSLSMKLYCWVSEPQGSTCVLPVLAVPSVLGLVTCCGRWLCFMWALGAKSSCLCSEHFTRWSLSIVLGHLFFFFFERWLNKNPKG